MSGPSEKAVQAALAACPLPARHHGALALDAAYPIVRADIIAEVVDALRGEWAKGRLSNYETQQDAAEFIEREFGATQDERCEDCGGTGQRVLNAFWPKGTEAHMEKCSTCGGSGRRS